MRNIETRIGNPLEKELLFVPLGGTEEIGMNFNLYGLGAPEKHDWLIIDMGITFGDDSTPGVEVIVPDPSFIAERREKLLGIILTHGHEDHLGAVPYLWDRLRCPIYATPFTAELLREKLKVNGSLSEIEIIEVPLRGHFTVGPFSLELITLTHSMPEPNAIVIRTPLGSIFHTGDWKFDPEPVVGNVSDEAALAALGDEGVLACIGDSTNIFVDGNSGSESSLLENMTKLIGKSTGKVAVTCFSSNVARIKTIFNAATANDRAVALVGRSLWRINSAARKTGYLVDLPPFLEAAEAKHIPSNEILYICTGSQGEPRAALSSIASGNNREVTFGQGDTVIFSSRIIPGNELSIGRLQNRLIQIGVDVISEHNEYIHVSGHPAREELIKMYQLIRPQIAIPVHGEPRHLVKHVALAKDCQVPETVLVKNGSRVKLGPGPATIIDEVSVGRFSAEGTRLHRLTGKVVKDRSRIIYNGVVVLTLILDKKGGIVGLPKLTTHALMDDDEVTYIVEILTDKIKEAFKDLSPEKLRDDDVVEETARITVRKSLRETYAKRPLVTVHIVRI
ncbi:MAG TPA: ribonuclease J [Rhodospirillales bacterium]|nr:ribonuclease J [Rhodospirillales bacterium]